MVFCCSVCCKEFRTNWQLQRHLRKKIPCKKNAAKEIEDAENAAKEIENAGKQTTTKEELPKCTYCCKLFSKKHNLKAHLSICKEKDDHVRCLEVKLDKQYCEHEASTGCRFCQRILFDKSALRKHIRSCKMKEEYKIQLEKELDMSLRSRGGNITNNNNSNNNNSNNITNNIQLNVTAETLREFGEEDTEHITNKFLLKVIGRLGVTLPNVVSSVAKQIYCDKNKPDNQTVQITNVRSRWAKVSNGGSYELRPLGETVSGVRNKVTDLYIERQCGDEEYFKKVNAKIEKLDDLNNHNYTARTLEDKEVQKNATKIKSEIDCEVKSTIYNFAQTII